MAGILDKAVLQKIVEKFAEIRAEVEAVDSPFDDPPDSPPTGGASGAGAPLLPTFLDDDVVERRKVQTGGRGKV